MNFDLDVFTTDGILKTSSAFSGVLSTSQGGTGQNWGASSGIPVLSAGTASLVTAPSGALVGDTDAQTLTNKSLQDSTTKIVDNSDPTKAARFEASGITAAATRVITIPDRDFTMAGLGGNETFTGAKDYSGATVRVPTGTGAITTTEGYTQWNTTRKLKALYDGTRERALSSVGFVPQAYHAQFDNTMAMGAAVTLAANGGTIIIPILVPAHMYLESVTIWNTDTATARTWGWDLYEDRNNASSTLNRVAQSTADQTFTPTVAAKRTINASATTYLEPGLYILAVQCRHASNNFGFGVTTGAGLVLAVNAKTKTLTNPNGATLDPVTATWTNQGSVPSGTLNGELAGSAW